jgi:GT2 family glycosyltransferase
MNHLPSISIVVPVYQAEATIDLCLKSLMNLDYPKKKFEIIVVDNASTDSSPQIIKKYDVQYIYEKMRNAYHARNRGLEQARFELIAFTDSDCIVTENWLKNIIKYLTDKEIAIVGGKILPYSIDNDVQKFIDFRKILDQEKMFQKTDFSFPFCVTANCVIKYDILKELGGFDTFYRIAGDADLCWKAQLKGLKIVYANDAIVYHKHRSDARNLYNQSFQYGFGRASLFKKYHDLFGKKIRFDWKEYIFLYESIHDFFLGKIIDKHPAVKNQYLYDIINMSGLISGKIYGSIKRRTIVF